MHQSSHYPALLFFKKGKMRRSFAPSSLHKKALHAQPLLHKTTPGITIPAKTDGTNSLSTDGQKNKENGTNNSSTNVIQALKQAPKRSLLNTGGGKLLRTNFRAPLVDPRALASFQEQQKAAREKATCYTVLYCKHSNKKHKSYNDGVVILKDGLCQLKDMDGKDVSRQRSKMLSFAIGDELAVGHWEIEVMTEVPEEDYNSGRVFLSNYSQPSIPSTGATESGGSGVSGNPLGGRGFGRGRGGLRIGGRGLGGGRGGVGRGRGLLAPTASSSSLTTPSVNVGGRTPVPPGSGVRPTMAGAGPSGTSSSNARGGGGTAVKLMLRGPSSRFTPMHSPDADGAIVLFRPSNEDGEGRGDAREMAVVVDPVLGRKLRPHQVEGVKFLWRCLVGRAGFEGKGAILADEMGLGKTLTTITVLWTMLRQGSSGMPNARKALVICPSSLVGNWGNEFKKWLGTERIRPLQVDVTGKEAKQRVADFVSCSRAVHPVLIISYEMFRKYQAVICAGVSVGLLVCDEGHRLKSSAANKTIQALNQVPTRSRLLVTGTPVQNDLQEFYSMVNFVNPGVLGERAAFKNIFSRAVEAGRDKKSTKTQQELGQKRSTELSRLTSPFILRRTSDQILRQYLPPKVELVVFCQPSDLQLELYRAQISSSKDLFKAKAGKKGGVGVDSAAALSLINSLKKLCNHPLLLQEKASKDTDGQQQQQRKPGGARKPGGVKGRFGASTVSYRTGGGLSSSSSSSLSGGCMELAETGPDAECKYSPAQSGKLLLLDLLLAEVRAAGQDRVVVVSNYTSTLDMLAALADVRGYNYVRLDGSTENSKRSGMVTTFNSPHSSAFLFFLSSKAGGVGLNLIGANRLVLFDPDWNPAIDQQAMARVWRDGQRKPVFIYRLLTTGTIEEKVYQRQVLKQEVSKAVVDAQSSAGRHFSHSDLKELFMLRVDTTCDTFELMDLEQQKLKQDDAEQEQELKKQKQKDSLRFSSSSSIVRMRSENSSPREDQDGSKAGGAGGVVAADSFLWLGRDRFHELTDPVLRQVVLSAAGAAATPSNGTSSSAARKRGGVKIEGGVVTFVMQDSGPREVQDGGGGGGGGGESSE